MTAAPLLGSAHDAPGEGERRSSPGCACRRRGSGDARRGVRRRTAEGRRASPPLPRRSVVWLDADGVDGATAALLARRGVDELVVRRGVASLAGDVPVLRLAASPPITGPIPTGIVLRLDGLRPDLDPNLADVLWRGIESDLGRGVSAELLLDLDATPIGTSAFIGRLAQMSSVPVLPVLLPEQLADEEALRVVAVSRGVVVPAFGSVATFRRGAHESVRPLAELLAPLVGTGARVRVAVVLEPESQPPLSQWREGLGALVDDGATEVSTSSQLDRTFTFRRTMSWNGRAWRTGEQVAVRWMDVARLNQALGAIGRLAMPEVGGWDLVSLPPEGRGLGIGRDALLAYLAGEGPEPELTVTADRRGGTVRATLSNLGPFASAVASFGNWVEISADGGGVAADERGDFDHISLGSRGPDGELRRIDAGGVTAVRFATTFVGPGAKLTTGPVRLPRSRSTATVRWQIVLSTGETVSGSLAVPP